MTCIGTTVALEGVCSLSYSVQARALPYSQLGVGNFRLMYTEKLEFLPPYALRKDMGNPIKTSTRQLVLLSITRLPWVKTNIFFFEDGVWMALPDYKTQYEVGIKYDVDVCTTLVREGVE